jgi:hypothetical protein
MLVLPAHLAKYFIPHIFCISQYHFHKMRPVIVGCFLLGGHFRLLALRENILKIGAVAATQEKFRKQKYHADDTPACGNTATTYTTTVVYIAAFTSA